MTSLALALLLSTASPADTLAPCVDAQTLTRGDLEAAGVGRLSDLARVLDALVPVSVDGFDADLGGFGLARPVRVLVDGQTLVASSTIEPAGLEMLPIAVGEIASVTYCPEPVVADGALRSASLQILTAPPARLYAAVDYGNEVGDPGPRRYVDRDRPNVDHEGPDAEAVVAFRSDRSAVWALARRRQLFPTDTAIIGRVRDGLAPRRFPKRAGQAWGARAATQRGGGHAVRVAALQFGDLPYLPGLGRELPVRRRTVQATAAGALPRRIGPVRVHYRAAASHLSMADPAWSALRAPGWRETRLRAAVEADARTPGRALRGGLQAEHLRASGSGLSEGRLTLGRLWAQSERRRGGNRETVRVALATTGDEVAASGAFVAVRDLAAVELALVLSGHRQLAAEAPDLAFWTARGYTGLDLDGVTHVRGFQAQSASEDRARLSARTRDGRVRVGGWLDARRQRADVVLHTLADRAAATPAVTARLVAAAGDEVQGEVWAEAGRPTAFVRVFARAGGAVRGSAAFREVWRRQPLVRAGLRAAASPGSGLRLTAHLEGRSTTTWTGTPAPDVPAYRVLDLALDKTVWDRRARLSLVGRNVLGAAERTHPLGATLAPRLHVRLDARL